LQVRSLPRPPFTHFNGDSSTTLHDIRSATKSLTSLLMCIAIDKKTIHSVDDPIA